MTASPLNDPADCPAEPPRTGGWLILVDLLVLTMALTTVVVLVGTYGVSSLALLGAAGGFVAGILAAWRRHRRSN